MTSTPTRLFALLMLAGLVSACEGGGPAPADKPGAETVGEAIAAPTDGVANEIAPD